VCVCVCVCISTRTWSEQVLVLIYMYIYIYIHMYMYICICMYILNPPITMCVLILLYMCPHNSISPPFHIRHSLSQGRCGILPLSYFFQFFQFFYFFLFRHRGGEMILKALRTYFFIFFAANCRGKVHLFLFFIFEHAPSLVSSWQTAWQGIHQTKPVLRKLNLKAVCTYVLLYFLLLYFLLRGLVILFINYLYLLIFFLISISQASRRPIRRRSTTKYGECMGLVTL
jgi:hypothetical protein